MIHSAGVEVRPLLAGECPAPPAPEDAFGALNAATVTDGPLINVADNVYFETPVRVYYLSTGSNGATANVRGYIRAGANSQVTVLESWSGTQAGYFNNATT